MKLAQLRVASVMAGLVVLAVLVATASGCGVINRIRSKNQLNEAARAFREGRYVEAEQHSRQAAELDPNNKTARCLSRARFTPSIARVCSRLRTFRKLRKQSAP